MTVAYPTAPGPRASPLGAPCSAVRSVRSTAPHPRALGLLCRCAVVPLGCCAVVPLCPWAVVLLGCPSLELEPLNARSAPRQPACWPRGPSSME